MAFMSIWDLGPLPFPLNVPTVWFIACEPPRRPVMTSGAGRAPRVRALYVPLPWRVYTELLLRMGDGGMTLGVFMTKSSRGMDSAPW